MLRFLRVRPIGMFSYGLTDWIDLDNQGLVELVGLNHDRNDSSNGAGKTSILSAIAVIGWGQDGRGFESDSVINKVWNKGCLGVLEFIAPDKRRCRAILARQWKSKFVVSDERSEIVESGHEYTGTVLYLEEWDTAEKIWRDRRAKTLPQTQQRCIAWLGMDFEMFCSVAFLAQGKVLQFMQGRPAEREKVISELLRLSVYGQAALIANQHASDMRKQLDIHRSVITEKERVTDSLAVLTAVQKQELEQYAAERKSAIDGIDTDLQRLQGDFHTISMALTKDAPNPQLVTIVGALQATRADLADIDSRQRVTQLEHAGKQYRLSTTVDGELMALEDKRRVQLHEIKRLESYVLEVSRLGGSCDVCGSKLTADHLATESARRATLLAQTRASLLAIDQALEMRKTAFEQERKKQLEAMQNVLHGVLSKAAADKAGIQNRLAALESQHAALIVEVEKDRLAHSSQMPVIQAQMAALQRSRGDQIAAQRVVEERLLASQHNEATKAAMHREVLDQKQTAAVLEDDLRYYIWWVRHADLLKIRKISSAIAVLNKLLAQYLTIATDGDIQAWVVPYRVRSTARKKDPDSLTAGDYLFEPDLIIREGKKDGVPSELYSGGEAGLIMLCLIFSFWELACRNGNGTNLVALDEIFGRWDDLNVTHVLSLFEYVRKRVSTIVFVTHQKSVRGMIDVDRVWQAEKKNHLSKLNVLL